MSEYYIYHLIDPTTTIPFYVGKGKNSRMYYHEKCVRRDIVPNRNKHLYYKIKQILGEGKDIRYRKVYENLSESDAWKMEIQEETNLKSQGINLCNLVPCGHGGNTLGNHPNKSEIYKRIGQHRPKHLTDKWKQNIGLGLIGTKHSDESKQKRSIKLRGKNNPMFGKSPSLETRDKIRTSNIGKIVSDETREKLRKLNLGRVRSDETRRRISQSKCGIKMSETARRNISKGHLGLVKSKKTIEKIRLANLGRKASEETKIKLSQWAKTRTGKTNPNYRPLSPTAISFIISNIQKSIYWITTHLPEKASYHRVKRQISEMKHSS